MENIYIQKMRAFNRFYTKILGLLDKHILNSSFTLIEARILHELNNNSSLTAADIIIIIDIDKGYLSRTLKKLEAQKLVYKVKSSKDKRALTLQLTETGIKEYKILEKASNSQIETLFNNLSKTESENLIKKLTEIELIITKGLNHE